MPKWRARIMVEGKSTSLGYHDSRADAERAYLAAKRELHPFYVTGIGRAA